MIFSDCTWGTLKWLQVRVVRHLVDKLCPGTSSGQLIAFLIFLITMKVFDIQDVDAHSCMVRKQLFLNIETLTMTFRGLQC